MKIINKAYVAFSRAKSSYVISIPIKDKTTVTGFIDPENLPKELRDRAATYGRNIFTKTSFSIDALDQASPVHSFQAAEILCKMGATEIHAIDHTPKNMANLRKLYSYLDSLLGINNQITLLEPVVLPKPGHKHVVVIKRGKNRSLVIQNKDSELNWSRHLHYLTTHTLRPFGGLTLTKNESKKVPEPYKLHEPHRYFSNEVLTNTGAVLSFCETQCNTPLDEVSELDSGKKTFPGIYVDGNKLSFESNQKFPDTWSEVILGLKEIRDSWLNGQ